MALQHEPVQILMFINTISTVQWRSLTVQKSLFKKNNIQSIPHIVCVANIVSKSF